MPRLLRDSVKFVLAAVLVYILAASAGSLLPNLQAQPVLTLSPGSARVGSDVSVSGTGFLPTDTTCTISSSSAVIASSACVTQGGTLSGSFTVGNVASGDYVIEATGDQGDSAQTVLDVSGGAEIHLSPTTGAPGTDIVVQGSGFLPADTSCSISSPSSPNPILSSACIVQGTVVTGSFMIGNVPAGDYVIQITSNQGDSAQALVEVG